MQPMSGGPNGHAGMFAEPPGGGKKRQRKSGDGFDFRMVFEAFTSLPRVLKLVWSTQPYFTLTLALINIARGFSPALSAWVTKLVIDSVVNAVYHRGEVNTVLVLVALQLLINIVTGMLGTASNIVQQLLQEQVSNRVRLMVMEKANTLDLSFFENPEFYDKLRQAQEQASFRPVAMVSQTFDLGRTIITFLSMIALLVSLEWWVAIVALLVPIPAFIADTRYGWIGYQRMRRQSPERRQMSYYETVMTTDSYNKEVKLFSLGNFFVNQFRTLSVKFYKENRAILVKRYLINFLWSCLSLAVNAGIYLYVAVQAVAGRITLGDLTLYAQAAQQVSSSFQGILSGISSTYENNLFVSTLFDFLEYEPKIHSPENPQPLLLNTNTRNGKLVPGLSVEFRDVTFTYPGKREPALRNLSFKIEAGEAVALVGRNGAGKTTLVKLLSRLYDPDEGEILVNGRNVREYELKELRQQVGVIFQDYVTYYMTARENIGVGRLEQMEDKELIAAAATKSGANSVIEKLPNQYDTMLGRWFDQGTQLSGGEWQKIALARAFMRDASILILDEPTSSLDAQAEYEVFAHFRELTEGKTAIFISHRFSTVRLADRIFVLENGTLQEQGSHRELMNLNGRYAELFNLQAQAYQLD